MRDRHVNSTFSHSHFAGHKSSSRSCPRRRPPGLEAVCAEWIRGIAPVRSEDRYIHFRSSRAHSLTHSSFFNGIFLPFSWHLPQPPATTPSAPIPRKASHA
ncbi:hypothetical protein ebA3292 [Aromatoleum aromaticum EbN1]|uniref:Uncharacterized protein n=1 Tax=Aromatoleum aromaticum (strain DSM 19018 / LMG 30748 / EbN1) TaxID=76114 RepID=Q5P3Y4_AROAE|nr:hypothetical protein ebA3292 [Aromatoleum aromaticum EbN1]